MPSALVTTDRAEFIAALPLGGRLAGLDVGTRTIGIALCDAQWTIASAAETIGRGKFTCDKARLSDLFDKQQVKGIVIGLPLNLDGSESPRAQATRAFALPVLNAGAAEPRRGIAQGLVSAVEKLEHSAGLLRLNLNEAAALEDFLLASLRLWSKRG